MYYITFSLISWLIIRSALSQSITLKEYDDLVCKNEPSCHLTNQPNLPSNRRTLTGRDCMCDFECVEYGDCCKDSEFYGAATASGKTYTCAPNLQIYMITTCPAGYSDQAVQSKCSAALEPLDGPDNSVIRPATNEKKRITYGNAYCALCHNDINDLNLWNLSARCGEAPAGYFDSQNRISELPRPHNPQFQPVKPTKSSKLPSFGVGYNQGFQVQFGSNTYKPSLNPTGLFRQRRQPLQINYNKHQKDLDNILENVQYDTNTKLYVSQYDGKNFICEFATKTPQNYDLYIRKCLANMVSSCPADTDSETAEKCSSNTAIVYEKASKTPYKNKDCAKCNKIPEVSLTGCPQQVRGAASALFSTSDKGSSPPCDTPELKKKFCSR